MQTEITQAVDFLGRLLNNKLDASVVDRFKKVLSEVLKARFQDHWDPQQPNKGNGYRALSNFHGILDPILCSASIQASIQPNAINAHLPREFVLWIDPSSVSYRVGENSNIMTLYEASSTSTTTHSTTDMSFIQQRTFTPIRISPPNSPPKKDNKEIIIAA